MQEVENPTWKFCHRQCLRYSWFRPNTSENCVKWRVDILDSNSKDDFEKLKAANFVLINESEIDKR